MHNQRSRGAKPYGFDNSQDVPVTPPSIEEIERLLFETTAHSKGGPHAKVEGVIRWTLQVLFEENAVVEVRAFENGRVISGYFDDHNALAETAAELDARGCQVYVTLNPVNKALLVRSANQIYERPRATTSDTDITRRRYLPLDFDPVREADAGATKAEKEAVFRKAKEVRDYLRGQGWPEPIIADSGNGFNFLYPIDLPNDADSKRLVKGVLEALASEFDDERVRLDTAVHNAARLIRLYGTRNRKGIHTEERPHRGSNILKVPEGA